MFGSTNPFGQSSTSPFGSQSGFGQTSNNPFAPKPFGSTNPFGSQSGGSFFGSTSTGVFGATPSSSPLGSTSVFGASSSPAFGSTTSAFGASSTPTFGSSSSAFGSSSVFGQKPAFGGFGSSSAQTSPFGSSFQQSQPAFGSGLFGSSSPFSTSSQPAFGTPSTPTFASSSTPAFGAPTTPAFGTSSTPAFGSTPNPTFGSTSNPFGVTSSPMFGSTTSAFGVTSTPAFGTTTAPAFGSTSTPGFGAQSAPSFSFGSSPAFGQSTSAFGSSPFGISTSTFNPQSSAFGTQTSAASFVNPGFGQSPGGGQRGGTRVAAYQATPEADGGSGTQNSGKLESISAMPVYKDKSHEELRWEDYQLGDKGGPAPAAQATSGINFGSSAFASSSTSPFGQSSANPFSSSTSSNPFAPKPSTFNAPGFGVSTTPAFNSSTFASSSVSNPFGSTSSASPSLFGSTPAFGPSTSPTLFGSSSASGFGSSTSIFGSSSAQATAPAFGPSLSFGNTQSSPLFQSTTPSFGQTTSAFGQTASSFAQSTPAFGQSNLFSTPSTGFGGNLFSSAPLLNTSNTVGFGQTTPSLSTPFQQQPSQNTAFGFNNFGQTQGAVASGFGGTPSLFSQPSAIQSSVVAQPVIVTNPFGTLPAMPQMSIGRTGTSSSIQYGISSLPVVDKPVPVRVSSLLTSRHLSQRRLRLPARKYHPKTEGTKVPFFSDDEETPSTPKADALFVPRENPRALVIRPLDQWRSKVGLEKVSPSKHTSSPAHENGKIAEVACAPVNETSAKDKSKDLVENGLDKEGGLHTAKLNQKTNGLHEVQHPRKGSSITLTGHRAGEAAIVYEHGADIEALMPKLCHSDYYTEPRIQELAAKERAEPGFCRRVKDFVVGRHGYGSIKFMGETDVRRLDLESLIQFNNREVIVYMDESKKPPVGQGLNKPTEVTLLNIKCFDKKTGQQFTEGPRIEKYKDMLQRKAADQGAEFVSYDPVKGEWKFRVQHFSKYRFQEDNEDDEYGENCDAKQQEERKKA
ncbi:Nuclear pore complex protein NUP98A [Capsicum annuum]|uniref:Nucleoporin autopeptidase n=1 Tax=Capsicum annuum TaxID=4072 RepID=A0A2G3AGI2_CAPAN|nr:nuclear pore complex protein NUP98A isoform X1 [Capsicum annuum]XP_016574569.2 nuclear pore complex protein NUP98A isoform X1 [Capsicum annuum]XP_047270910.1 nuclear pore complex protein NUP98A isoform X1 [Capsicum annuum]PHT93344.1 Nuclear pore complex protein NUP98A [Capsicum annuum]